MLVKYGQAVFCRDRPDPDVATEAKLTGKPMNRDPSLIDALFARYGVSGTWVVGIGIAAIGLRLIRIFVLMRSAQFDDNPDIGTIAQSLSHMDGQMILTAVALSLLAGVLAGLYPAWRIGRLAPATFLKIQ